MAARSPEPREKPGLQYPKGSSTQQADRTRTGTDHIAVYGASTGTYTLQTPTTTRLWKYWYDREIPRSKGTPRSVTAGPSGSWTKKGNPPASGPS